MEEQRVDARHAHEVNYSKLDWVIFLVSFALMLFLLKYESRFFWVALPFAGTYLVKALKQM